MKTLPPEIPVDLKFDYPEGADTAYTLPGQVIDLNPATQVHLLTPGDVFLKVIDLGIPMSKRWDEKAGLFFYSFAHLTSAVERLHRAAPERGIRVSFLSLFKSKSSDFPLAYLPTIGHLHTPLVTSGEMTGTLSLIPEGKDVWAFLQEQRHRVEVRIHPLVRHLDVVDQQIWTQVLTGFTIVAQEIDPE